MNRIALRHSLRAVYDATGEFWIAERRGLRAPVRPGETDAYYSGKRSGILAVAIFHGWTVEDLGAPIEDPEAKAYVDAAERAALKRALDDAERNPAIYPGEPGRHAALRAIRDAQRAIDDYDRTHRQPTALYGRIT